MKTFGKVQTFLRQTGSMCCSYCAGKNKDSSISAVTPRRGLIRISERILK